MAVPLLLLTALLGFLGWMYAANWRPRVSDFPIQGVDVSADDGAIDWWASKKSGVSFVYARATSGASYRDPQFAESWRLAGEAGLKRGALHVYSLCQSALAQAGNFVSTVPRVDDQLPPALLLDFDSACAARPGRNQVLAEIEALAKAIETHSERKVVLKVSKAFEAEYRVSEGTTRPLWSRQAFFPPWYLARNWTMWQASGFRRIEGADRPVNWDVMAK
ncbi:GH25 family lysozyme [Sphingomonas sp. MMS12-HWE2-04]|uniref:GH25 family lysozyme n=1 Tax=Sphingomonas sp. MMS12-HWE2-04 TaxID=3234199 RepID=UPI003851493D